MSRTARQAMIISLIDTKVITTQEELAIELKKAGFSATQATVSRDIKELNLVKTLDNAGNYKYSVYTDNSSKASHQVLSLIKSFVTSMVVVNNLVVLRSEMGCGDTLANMLEQINIVDMVGIVSGSRTATVICADNISANEVYNNISHIIA